VTYPAPAVGDRSRSKSRYALAALVAFLIAYGSLYPFVFQTGARLSADLSHFLGGWWQLPTSRGDVLANLLLYIPLGLAATLAFSQDMPRSLGAVLAVLCGAALSFLIELAQFYDASRVSAFSDFCLNVIGLVAGTIIALVAGAGFLRASWPAGAAPAFARLLLLAWLGWRLYPYVSTLQLHRYWRSLEPMLLAPSPSPAEVAHYAVLWLSVIFLFRTGVHRSFALLVLAILGFFAAKASILEQTLSLPELMGAVFALLLSPLLMGRFSSVGVPMTAAMLVLFVILSRVLPWQFSASPKAFQWIPFIGFLQGSQQVNTISFLQKFYLYGAVILFLVQCGLKLRIAVGLECAALFATSLLQTFMVDRSAEISDALLALTLGAVYVFLRRRYLQQANLRHDIPAQTAELRG